MWELYLRQWPREIEFALDCVYCVRNSILSTGHYACDFSLNVREYLRYRTISILKSLWYRCLDPCYGGRDLRLNDIPLLGNSSLDTIYRACQWSLNACPFLWEAGLDIINRTGHRRFNRCPLLRHAGFDTIDCACQRCLDCRPFLGNGGFDITESGKLTITINESISDILRGYIIERFVYEYNGTIVYHNTNVYNKYKFINNTNFFGEKEIFFNLNEIISIIKLNECSKDNSKNLLFSILSELIKKNILKNKELFKYIFWIYLLSSN